MAFSYTPLGSSLPGLGEITYNVVSNFYFPTEGSIKDFYSIAQPVDEAEKKADGKQN